MLRRIRHETGEGLICGVEIGDPVRPIEALFLHATGFNAMTYQSMLAPLGLRAHVAAIDLRGHGRTTLPANGRFPSWSTYRNDVIAWLEKRAPGGAVLGGHSMGGTVAMLVAGKRPDLVKALVLADPVVLPPTLYRWAHLTPFPHIFQFGRSAMSRGALRRRREFPSREAAKLAYAGRRVFSTWREPFLDDYLLDGIDRVDDGPPDSADQTWSLLCDPKWEAATFAAQRNRPWAALRKIRRHNIPASVLVADKESVMPLGTLERIARIAPHVHMRRIGGTTHFLPMEAPYAVREELSAYLSNFVEGLSQADHHPVKRRLK